MVIPHVAKQKCFVQLHVTTPCMNLRPSKCSCAKLCTFGARMIPSLPATQDKLWLSRCTHTHTGTNKNLMHEQCRAYDFESRHPIKRRASGQS